MEEIDQLIKETLTQEEAIFYDELDEQNMFQMITGLFSGKNKWIMYGMNIVTFIFFILFVYCANYFFKAELTNELIYWGTLSTACIFGMSMLKIFAWMQMDKNAILREMKRIELQISSLSGRMK